MKPGYQTTEFWLTLITSISGLLVALGVITPVEGGQVSETLTQAVAAAFSLIALVQYIRGRSAVKSAALAAGRTI